MNLFDFYRTKHQQLIGYNPLTTICSIDFSIKYVEDVDFKKRGEELNKSIDTKEFNNLAIVVRRMISVPSNGNKIIVKPLISEYIINFEEGKPLTDYTDEILKLIPKGCCITAYNGYRMDFIALERKFKINLKDYILVDTMRIEKHFDNDCLREMMCIDINKYPKTKLGSDGKMHIESLLKSYINLEMYESPFVKKHMSSNDALVNLDLLMTQFYMYGFTCFEEMQEMTEHFMDMQDKDDYMLYHIKNYDIFYIKINRAEYLMNKKFVFNFGRIEGLTVEGLDNDRLIHMLKKYMIPFKRDGVVVNKHDPYLYEILYVLRLEYLRRIKNKLI